MATACPKCGYDFAEGDKSANPVPHLSYPARDWSEIPQFWELDLFDLTWIGWGLFPLAFAGLIIGFLLTAAASFAVFVAFPGQKFDSGTVTVIILLGISIGGAVGQIAYKTGWRYFERRGYRIIRGDC